MISCLATVVCLALGGAGGGDDGSGLSDRIAAVLAAPGYESARWGVLVQDAATGEVLYERSADQMFRPASVTKLFTCAAALTRLGAEYRFRTTVYRLGELDDQGTLRGDLILVAGGDPSLGGRTSEDGTLLFTDVDHSYASPNSKASLVAADPRAGLDQLAREIASAGIRRIEGDVLVDERLFEPAPSTGSGPNRVSAIVVNDNVIDVVIEPGKKDGEPARVRIVPETAYVTFDATVTTSAKGGERNVEIERVGERRFVVTGSIPVDSEPLYQIYEVDDAASFARTLLVESLRRRGVKLLASPLSNNRPRNLPDSRSVATLPRVAQYVSPPLKEYLRVVLKVSQNLHASMLPLILAAEGGRRNLTDGLLLEGQVLKGLGVDTDSISLGSGAGGSPSDLVTPRATVALLRAMAERPEFAAYESALPILGRDGTLAQSVGPDSLARGHVRAKTGTYYVSDGLTGKSVLTSKSLAGYMETSTGRDLVFAIFINDIPLQAQGSDVQAATAEAGRLLGRFCEILYTQTPEAKPVKTEKVAAPAPPPHSRPSAPGGSPEAPAPQPREPAPSFAQER